MSQNKDFRMTLSIVNKERSKDSNSTIERWQINDGKLLYSVTYTGRRGPNQKNSKKEVSISQDNIKAIKALIAEKNLYQNIPSPKYAEFKTPYMATEVSFTVNKEEDSYHIQLYDLSREISKNGVYQNIKVLKRLLENL